MRSICWLLICSLFFPGIIFAQEFIQIKGSDTEVNLVQNLAEIYMEQHPEVSIAVTGGGSGTGIAALLNKRVDIANSSRPITAEETAAAKKRGIKPTKVVFALDGLTIISHYRNPINSLTLDQLGKIYRGEITNWKELAGPDLTISLYGRQPNSGTYVYFRAEVLKGDYSPRMKEMNGNAQIVEAVRRDKGSIGYVGIGYVIRQGKVIEGIKVFKLARDDKSLACDPIDPENVTTGRYPLARPLYQYTNGFPQGHVLDFIRFELSPQGQEVIQSIGFYPVSKKYQEANKASGF